MSIRGRTGGTIVLSLLVLAAGCGPAHEAPWPEGTPKPRMQAVVDFTRAQGRRVPVTVQVEGVKPAGFSFTFLGENEEYRVHNVKFFDGAGKKIVFRRRGMLFQLDPFEGDTVRGTYEAQPGGMGRHGQQGIVAEDFATFDGRLYLMPKERSNLRAVRVRFVTPKGWVAATPFRADGGWYYTDTLGGKNSELLLEKNCVGVGRFDVESKQLGEMEVRVASYAGWEAEHKQRLADSSFRLLDYYHDALGFDLKSPFLVVWTPSFDGKDVHGGADVSGTCLQQPVYRLRPYQLLAHRTAHSMDKYHPSGMEVSDPKDRWFREGWDSYMEVVATKGTSLAEDHSHFNVMYGAYKSTLRDHPEHDVPLAQEPDQRGEVTEYLHYTKGPLAVRMLAELVESRSGHTIVEFMGEMWKRHGWYVDPPFSLRTELAEFTGANFDDFWAMMVDTEGHAIPVWDEYFEHLAPGAAAPAARVGQDGLPGDYLHYLAQTGDFKTFAAIRDFVVAEEARRRQLLAHGIRLYSERLARALPALPGEDRYAIARYEASHPLAAPSRTEQYRFEPDLAQPDGKAFAELLSLEHDYLAAVARGAITGIEVASKAPRGGVGPLAFAPNAALTVDAAWRAAPGRERIELVRQGETTQTWTHEGRESVWVRTADLAGAVGVVAFRVSDDGRSPVTRGVWLRAGAPREARAADGAAGPDRLVSKNPKDADGWFKRGLVLATEGDHAAALDSFVKATELTPKNALYWNKRGEMLAALERFDEALTAFDKALALNARFLAAGGNKALALADLDRRKESLAALDALLAANAGDAAGHYWKGRVLEHLGELEPASLAYRAYVEALPRRAEGWTGLGRCLAALERPEQAVEAYDRALKIDPKNAEAERERSRARRALGLEQG